jgi:hypothetical protein
MPTALLVRGLSNAETRYVENLEGIHMEDDSLTVHAFYME